MNYKVCYLIVMLIDIELLSQCYRPSPDWPYYYEIIAHNDSLPGKYTGFRYDNVANVYELITLFYDAIDIFKRHDTFDLTLHELFGPRIQTVLLGNVKQRIYCKVFKYKKFKRYKSTIVLETNAFSNIPTFISVSKSRNSLRVSRPESPEDQLRAFISKLSKRNV